MARLGDLYTKNRSGKAVLSLPKGARVLPPQPLTDAERDSVAVVSTEGRLLLVPVKELPALAKGKGVKIMGIPSARLAAREEFVRALAVVPEEGSLTIYSGQRHMTLKPRDLAHYRGERGRRGNKLPQGFRKVERMVGRARA